MTDLNTRIVRVAAYLRYSSEHQRGNTSLDAQLAEIENWCVRQNPPAQITHTYVDEAKTARNISRREAVKRLNSDASQHRFDAVVVAAFDRLSRNMAESTAAISYLRDDCGLKVYSATEIGADDDERSGALMEGIKGVLNQNYSLELSKAFKRGKRQIWKDGYFIGSTRPYGFKIIRFIHSTNRFGKPVYRHYLEPIAEEVAVVQEIYELYATGHHSQNEIAQILNKRGLKTSKGKNFQPFTIQGILTNRVYLSEMRHQPAHTDMTRTKIWYKAEELEFERGKHDAVISQELFDTVAKMLEYRKAVKHGAERKDHAYLLQGLVWCWHCHEMHQDHSPVFGKMQCKADGRPNDKRYSYYLCTSRYKGYDCPQPKIQNKGIDAQVLWVLRNLRLPNDWKQRLIKNVALGMNDAAREARIEQIKAQVERLDRTWQYDGGVFLPEKEYVAQRAVLVREFNQLQPSVTVDTVAEAADMVTNFSKHFDTCNGDVLLQNQLVRKLVDRVYVHDDRVVAIQFHDDTYNLLHLGGDVLKSHEDGVFELTDEQLQRQDDEMPVSVYDDSEQELIVPPDATVAVQSDRLTCDSAMSVPC